MERSIATHLGLAGSPSAAQNVKPLSESDSLVMNAREVNERASVISRRLLAIAVKLGAAPPQPTQGTSAAQPPIAVPGSFAEALRVQLREAQETQADSLELLSLLENWLG